MCGWEPVGRYGMVVVHVSGLVNGFLHLKDINPLPCSQWIVPQNSGSVM